VGNEREDRGRITHITKEENMAKFRKKPVVIEAIQFIDHTSLGDICEFMNVDGLKTGSDSRGIFFFVPTLEGSHMAIPGDWIIRGVQGEFYPCKPDIFEQTYEKVE